MWRHHLSFSSQVTSLNFVKLVSGDDNLFKSCSVTFQQIKKKCQQLQWPRISWHHMEIRLFCQSTKNAKSNCFFSVFHWIMSFDLHWKWNVKCLQKKLLVQVKQHHNIFFEQKRSISVYDMNCKLIFICVIYGSIWLYIWI